MFGWFGDSRDKDVKINIIAPATEVHIRKVSSYHVVLNNSMIESHVVHEARANPRS
jgi:hypothetical protein